MASTLAATAAGLAGLGLPGAVAAQTGLRKNFSGLAGGKRVIVGNVALACLIDRKRQILVGGGFRSLGAASSNVVQTTLAGLTEADFQAAADAAYAATVEGLTAQGFEVLDNAPLVAKLKAKNLAKSQRRRNQLLRRQQAKQQSRPGGRQRVWRFLCRCQTGRQPVVVWQAWP